MGVVALSDIASVGFAPDGGTTERGALYFSYLQSDFFVVS